MARHRMKIGVDGACWLNRRGYGRYMRELFGALFALDTDNTYRFFVDAATARAGLDLPTRAELVVVETGAAAAEAAGAAGSRSPRDLMAMSNAVRRHGKDLDLFYFPSVYTFYPVFTPARVIVTIHDTIAERFPRLIFPNRRAQLFWRIKVLWALRQADLVATVSGTAKSAIQAEFGLPADRIRIIPDAVGPEFFPIEDRAQTRQVLCRYGIDTQTRYVLYVGGISPHKNLATLIDGFSLLCDGGQIPDRVKLVLVGDFQGDVFFSSYPELRKKADALQTAGTVLFTGFVPDEDLVHFYNGADVLALPSFDEGFGLPAVEAMACGVPVAASRAGSLPEVVGDAGRFFDPYRAEEIAACLGELLGQPELRHDLGQRGLVRARIYTWKRSAQEALACFEAAQKVRGAAR